MNNLRDSAKRVQEILHQYNIDAKVVEFTELTRTSQEAANTIGCEVGQIAKTLIFKGKNSGQPVCIIASGVNRVDEKKVSGHIGEPIERADPDFVLKWTGFAIGGVAPIGFKLESAVLIDEDLMGYPEIWAAAGTPYAVFQLSPINLLKITHGQVANIKK
ncbi:YbaK/EbsC family protein [Chlamydiota bacterium]